MLIIKGEIYMANILEKYKRKRKINYYNMISISGIMTLIKNLGNSENMDSYYIDYFTNRIIESNSKKYIYEFARDIKNLSEENIDILTKGIIETKDAWYIYQFAKEVKNLSDENIDILTKGIIETKNAKYIYFMYKKLKNIVCQCYF